MSLEFPERYHCIEKGFVPLNHTACLLTEMLAKFTETEALEGRIYACDQCNSECREVEVEGERCVHLEYQFKMLLLPFQSKVTLIILSGSKASFKDFFFLPFS